MLEVGSLANSVALFFNNPNKWEQDLFIIKTFHLFEVHEQFLPLSNRQSVFDYNTIDYLIFELIVHFHVLVKVCVEVKLVLFHFRHFVPQL